MRAPSVRMMLGRMTKILIAAALTLALAACGPLATTPGPSPSSVTPPPGGTASGATPTLRTSASPTPGAGASGTPIPMPTSARVAAAGDGVVWMLVAETRLFRSTDRGATWSERSRPPGGAQLEIAFVSERDGWAAQIGSPATQCQSQRVTVWRTSDGASTWQKLDTTGVADAQCKERLAFVDTQHGFLDAYDPNSPPVIYRTADGGRTWAASARLPDPPGFISAQAGFTLRPGAVADFGGVLLLSAVGMSNRTEQRYVFRSVDGGATWTFVTSAPDARNELVFLTETRWLQITPPDASRETTDGGRSWHPFTTDYRQAAPVAPQIAFGDASTGYATVRGGLQRTTDGGAHWTPLRTPGT